MMDAPTQLIFIRREEGVMNCIAYLYDWTTNELPESSFVAYFLTECYVADEDNLLSEYGDLEYLT